MKKVIKLNESDLIRLVNQVLNEQSREMDPYTPMPGVGDRLNRTAGNKGSVEYQKILDGRKLDGSLFLNGIDKIDKSSQAYVKALNDFKKLANEVKGKNLGSLTIDIEGGASAVGSAQGYNNKALAQRRATNFINAIKQDIPNSPFIFNTTSKVGKATVKNSPEANAEQYVKISFSDIVQPSYKQGQIGRDNTAIRYGQPIPKKGVTPTDEERPYMVLKVYYNEGSKKSVLNKFYGATRSERTVTIDVTDQAKDCGL
jgi:hypothetical protein